MNEITNVVKNKGTEEGIKTILGHYKGTEFYGSWVDKLVNNVEQADVLLNVSHVDVESFTKDQVIKIKFSGPDGTYYSGSDYELDLEIPVDYPKGPIDCYINKGIYHLNVE